MGDVPSGASAMATTASRCAVSTAWKNTSRLSGNSRKNDRSCIPARAAICAPVVWSKPWAANSSTAALASLPRGFGSHRPMPPV